MTFLEKLNIREKLNIDDLYNTFLGLEKRLQILTGVGIGLVALIFILLPLSWVTATLNQTETDYNDYMDSVTQFYNVVSDYTLLNGQLGSTESGLATSGKKLSDVIYDIAEKSGIEANKIKISQNTTNLTTGDSFNEIGQDGKIQQVPFEAVLKFLQGVEKNPGIPLKIKKLEMKVDPKNRQNLKDVSFTISAIKSNKEKESASE